MISPSISAIYTHTLVYSAVTALYYCEVLNVFGVQVDILKILDVFKSTDETHQM